jgi:hypothetical protein
MLAPVTDPAKLSIERLRANKSQAAKEQQDHTSTHDPFCVNIAQRGAPIGTLSQLSQVNVDA